MYLPPLANIIQGFTTPYNSFVDLRRSMADSQQKSATTVYRAGTIQGPSFELKDESIDNGNFWLSTHLSYATLFYKSSRNQRFVKYIFDSLLLCCLASDVTSMSSFLKDASSTFWPLDQKTYRCKKSLGVKSFKQSFCWHVHVRWHSSLCFCVEKELWINI